jgi:hypothetical protein
MYQYESMCTPRGLRAAHANRKIQVRLSFERDQQNIFIRAARRIGVPTLV